MGRKEQASRRKFSLVDGRSSQDDLVILHSFWASNSLTLPAIPSFPSSVFFPLY